MLTIPTEATTVDIDVPFDDATCSTVSEVKETHVIIINMDTNFVVYCEQIDQLSDGIVDTL